LSDLKMVPTSLKEFLFNIKDLSEKMSESEFQNLLKQDLTLLHKTIHHVNSSMAGVWVSNNLIATVEMTDLKKH
jgi:hypothetical protein